jgi:hypothetical protein
VEVEMNYTVFLDFLLRKKKTTSNERKGKAPRQGATMET